MTQKDYNDLWVEFGKAKPKCSMPDYLDYLESENMFEDYLDIFRGENTRSERSNGHTDWYYEHPFFDGDKPKLENKPCIKYVMIGEARPKSNPVNKNSCGADENNTYFYNTTHVGKTLWLSQPFRALCPTGWVKPKCEKDKIDILLQLATAGYLLVDLFPFSMSYNKDLRASLNQSGATQWFWNGLNGRIGGFAHLLCANWDLAMGAPCTISEFIVNPINGFNPLAIIPQGNHPNHFRDIKVDATRCLGAKWRKIAVSSAGQPTKNLIVSAY